MSRRLSTAEVSRILGLDPERVRRLVRAGLCRPARESGGYAFSFQDLVVLRAAQGLLAARVPVTRVRHALAALVGQLPEDRPMSGLRIFADGRHVAVRDGGTAWQPETGQVLLDFEVDELAQRVSSVRDAPRVLRDAAERAQLEFERALELEAEEPKAAAAAYARAIELDPELIDAHVNLGRLTHEAGDAAEAVRLYEYAIKRAPEDPLIHFNLALALEDLQGAAVAVAHYERAVELDPEFADAHYNLAGLCEQLGRSADALRHYHAYKKLTGR